MQRSAGQWTARCRRAGQRGAGPQDARQQDARQRGAGATGRVATERAVTGQRGNGLACCDGGAEQRGAWL